MRFLFILLIPLLHLLKYADEGFLTAAQIPHSSILPCPTCSSKANSPSARKNVSIAIIGAGFAGLTAYTRLLELGFSNVHLFEASQRVGGRVFPVEFEKGVFLQQGAEFINGKQNPIFEMANRLRLIVGEVDDDALFADEAGAVFVGVGPDCEGLSPDTINRFSAFTAELELNYSRLAQQSAATWTSTIGEMFQRDYAQFLDRENNHIARGHYDGLAQMYRSYYEGEWASPVNRLSLHNYAQWRDGSHSFPFGSFALDSRGYAPILTELSKGIMADHLHLGNRVVNIDYGGGGPEGVRLTVRSEATGRRGKWPASFDFVIVTVPIGHLKRFARSLFTPPLPPAKMDFIRAVGFGAVQKLFIIFDRPFWPANMTSLVALDCADIDTKGKRTTAVRDCLHTFQPHPWAKNVLVVWLSGNGPEVINRLSDEQLSEQVVQQLSKLLSASAIATPVRIVRTKWLADELYLGSYSYISPEASRLSPDPFSLLAQPVFSAGERRRPIMRLLFAGEGTHSHMFQTTVGAFLSGQREADRLANYLDNVGEE